MNEKILTIICWLVYTSVGLFMTLYPILIGVLTPVTECEPISGNVWLYVQGSLQFMVFGFFFPFCFDTYLYYCTDTQNTIPKTLFKISLIGTTVGTIISVGWGIAGIYTYTQCNISNVVSQSVIGLGVIDSVLYLLGSVLMIGLVALDLSDS